LFEEVLLKYMNQNMKIKSYTERSSSQEDEFYVIDRIGGSSNRSYDTSTIAIQSYAKTKYRAAKNDEAMRKCILEMVSLDNILNVELNSFYDYTDTNTKNFRYQSVFEFKHY